MNDLVTLYRNDAVVSSLQIAEHFGKQHKVVLKAIENAKSTEHNFVPSESPFRKSFYEEGREV